MRTFISAILLVGMSIGYATAQVTLGTGFFVTPTGLIATCHHVIAGATTISVINTVGDRLEAIVVQVDPANDLALLRVAGDSFPFVRLRRSSELRKGDSVVTIGFPNIDMQGREPKLTEGIVSALSGLGGAPSLFQISVPVQPGNSGGPLLDRSGAVVGVINAKLGQAAALRASGALPENVNYAIKSNYLIELTSIDPRDAGRVALQTGRASSRLDLPAIVKQTERAIVIVVAQNAVTGKVTPNAPSRDESKRLPSIESDRSRPPQTVVDACTSDSDCSNASRCLGVPRRCVAFRGFATVASGGLCKASSDCADSSDFCIGSPKACQRRFPAGVACVDDNECSGRMRCDSTCRQVD